MRLAARRILFLRAILLVCLAPLVLQLVRWQWISAYDLASAACRQRLMVTASLGFRRADFCDRYGRLLTGRERTIVPALPAGAAIRRPAVPQGSPSRFFHAGARLPVTDRYGENPLAVHLLGYLNPGDGRGAAGLEKACESLLARGGGDVLAEVVDGRRRILRGLGPRLLQLPGGGARAVRLTIDRDLQEKVEAVADRSLDRGAIVIMSPKSGDILAMASRPAFAPSRPELSLRDKGSPFLNRAVAAYHPGSIFKLVVLAAALESSPSTYHRLYYDRGTLDLGTIRFNCPGPGHGYLSLADALAYSCNTVFIRLGLELGAARLIGMAERLGLGGCALPCLPGENPGELPPKEGRSRGDVANVAIGQQDVFATPLQVARLVSAVANGGLLPAPRLIMGWQDARGRLIPLEKKPRPARVLSQRTARLMRVMMEGVVRYGTGRAASLPCGAGGKTGTAQTGACDERGRPVYHAWFAGYAPADEPEYVAVVFVENGDSGGGVAAPIFRSIMASALGSTLAGTGTGDAPGT